VTSVNRVRLVAGVPTAPTYKPLIVSFFRWGGGGGSSTVSCHSFLEPDKATLLALKPLAKGSA
jgi:hypothetical protein